MALRNLVLVFTFVLSIASDNLAIKDTVIEQALQLGVLISFAGFVAICAQLSSFSTTIVH